MNRTRRLCMVVHGPYPENRVAAEALAAIDAGWSVDVVAMRRPGERAEEMVDGVRIYRLPMSRTRATGLVAAAREYFGFTFLATARVAALFRRRRYAVVHVHNPPDFLIVASIVPKALGARVIFDIHDFAPELFSMRFCSKRGAEPAVRLLRLVERLVAGFADEVVTVHEPYRRALTTRGVPADKITIVLNSLDERLVPNEQQAPSGDDTFRVVYHGTITPHYGVELLVEAAARLARTSRPCRSRSTAMATRSRTCAHEPASWAYRIASIRVAGSFRKTRCSGECAGRGLEWSPTFRSPVTLTRCPPNCSSTPFSACRSSRPTCLRSVSISRPTMSVLRARER